MDIHLQQLRYFMELAKQLNFTKAAMNLYIAQPALSQQIADMEKQLGVTLFERTSRSVSLTPAGEILQEAVPDLLSELEHIHKQLLSAQAGLQGSLKIGYLSSFQSFLPGILEHYQELYPDVSVELFCDTPRKMLTELRSQHADIVFTILHPELLAETAAYIRQDFWQDGIRLVMRKDHPFALSGGTDYSLLQDLSLSLLDEETVPDFHRLVQDACKDAGLSISKLVSHKSWEPILMQVKTGAAVSVFSTFDSNLFCGYQQGLTSFPLRENCLHFCALWNPQSKNAALPLFLDVLEASFHSTATT